MQEHQGKIARYFNERGFGFIAGDDGAEIFFHVKFYSPPNTAPNVNARVRYKVRANQRDGWPEAFDVAEIANNAKPQKTLRGNDPVWR
jgi:CspA family cold shock protein